MLAIPASPLVIDGQGCPWTRAGVKLHAELEGIAPALIDALIEARYAVELSSCGIVVTGE